MNSRNTYVGWMRSPTTFCFKNFGTTWHCSSINYSQCKKLNSPITTAQKVTLLGERGATTISVAGGGDVGALCRPNDDVSSSSSVYRYVKAVIRLPIRQAIWESPLGSWSYQPSSAHTLPQQLILRKPTFC